MKESCKAKLIRLKTGKRYQRLFSKDSGSFGIKSGHVILKPGENIGEHTTGEREEMVVILKGKGEARIAKENILKIKGNSALHIPPETPHDIKNTGRGTLEYIFITSRTE
ncbi:cupin domain-containing protein [Candidatus Omnitrophota bacterium]